MMRIMRRMGIIGIMIMKRVFTVLFVCVSTVSTAPKHVFSIVLDLVQSQPGKEKERANNHHHPKTGINRTKITKERNRVSRRGKKTRMKK